MTDISTKIKQQYELDKDFKGTISMLHEVKKNMLEMNEKTGNTNSNRNYKKELNENFRTQKYYI